MHIVEAYQHRVLVFIDACNSSGYQPYADEVEVWLRSTTRSASGRSVDPAGRGGAHHSSSHHDGTSRHGPVDPSTAGPATGESAVRVLQELMWISPSEPLALTPLGRALLRATERGGSGDGEGGVVVLDGEDSLAYQRLLGRFARAGDALLVDPHIRLEQLAQLVTTTEITRVLTQQHDGASREVLANMAIHLSSSAPQRPVEVRVSGEAEVHDRVLITTGGQVHLFGYSLEASGDGPASSVLVRLPHEAARARARSAQAWWDAAEPLVPARLSAVARSPSRRSGVGYG